MAKTSIEWTDTTWNPVTGCNKISAGCKNCYAEVMHRRLQAMGVEKYAQDFTTVRIHPSELLAPHTWKKPRMVFVNSMSDLFHANVPAEFIGEIFEVMAACPQHTFQVLTKRAERMAELAPKLLQKTNFPENIWLGVSVEDSRQMGRIEHLRSIVGAAVRFLSIEPLLAELPLTVQDLKFIHWVIVGGESGHGARPMKKEWVTHLRDVCQEAGVAFFFKQWGGANKKAAGRLLDGREWSELPTPPPF
jgi:protein gp37